MEEFVRALVPVRAPKLQILAVCLPAGERNGDLGVPVLGIELFCLEVGNKLAGDILYFACARHSMNTTRR